MRLATLLGVFANLCVAVAMIFLVSKLASLDLAAARNVETPAPAMGRQISSKASELGHNAYEASLERR